MLKKEEAVTSLQIHHVVAGETAIPPRKKYRDCNARLSTVVSDYHNRSVIEYLRGVACNFQF